MNKKSPKRSSTSELVDIDPKFTDVKFKFNQEIEKDTIIIPLHSPSDSLEELIVNDSDSNIITKAVVHVSYEPKHIQEKTILTKTLSDDITVNQITALKTPVDNVNNIVNSAINKTVENAKTSNKNNENFVKNSNKITNNFVKAEESTLLPNLNSLSDPLHSANSNDTSPDSEVMSSLSIAATEEEKKKLFSHPNSLDEELPHVPTTLPLERSVAAPIIPVKYRITETKTCSLDRPARCSTPNNADLPAGLGTYAIAAAFEEAPTIASKIQITLPKLKKRAAAADPPRKRRRARSVNALATNGVRWVDDFEDERKRDDGRPVKTKSPKKITALPASMRPRRGSSSANACGCDCHHGGGGGGPFHDAAAWPLTRERSDTT